MLQCIDDITNGDKTTFIFSDQTEVVAVQQHHESPPRFKLETPNQVTTPQIDAIKKWSACPVS